MSVNDEFWEVVARERTAADHAAERKADTARLERDDAREARRKLKELCDSVAPKVAELANDRLVAPTIVVRRTFRQTLRQDPMPVQYGWAVIRAYGGTGGGGGKVEMHSSPKAGVALGGDGSLYGYRSRRNVIDDEVDAVNVDDIYEYDAILEHRAVRGPRDGTPESRVLQHCYQNLSVALRQFVGQYNLHSGR